MTAPADTAQFVPVDQQPGKLVPAQVQAPGTIGIDYFADASMVPKQLATQVGCSPCRALQIVMFPQFITTQLQDPKIPLNADEYTVRSGAMQPPTPVRFLVEKPTEASMRENSFDLEKEVPWQMLPKLIGDTPALTKIDGAKVTHLLVKRQLPFKADVIVYVFAEGPRRNGWVEFSNMGAVIKVHD